MTEAEKQAIERCKELIKIEHANWIGISNQDAIGKVLNLIEKKDKKIDLMAKFINNFDIDEDICKKVQQPCKDYAGQNGKLCEDCIKEYFKKKVEGKDE